MKKTLLTIALITLATFAAQARDLGTADPAVKSQIASTLTAYYGVKDALVDSDAEAASAKAAEMLTAFDAIDVSKMNAAQKALWEKLGPRIRTDTSHINKNKDLEHQREHFMKLSGNVYSVVFNFKANSDEAFLHYCPMKKATWLSTTKEVRNPYYGKKMLTCGSVRATLKKN